MRGRLIVAGVLGFVGAVWIGQGLGLLRTADSFMVDDVRWAMIGAGLVIVAIVLVVTALRARQRT